jgi:hypothetical protein
MNILGVLFDYRLQWAQHVASSIVKANKPSNNINWAIPQHHQTSWSDSLKILLDSVLQFRSMASAASETPIKTATYVHIRQSTQACLYKPDPRISFIKIHELNRRATPSKIYKLYNERQPLTEWSHLNFQNQFSMLQEVF